MLFQKKNTPVIIVGAGPAGIACAIQLRRYGIDFEILERNIIGGLLNSANLVENYPGFAEGIRGSELIRSFRRHLQKWNIFPAGAEIIKVTYNQGKFKAFTNDMVYESLFLVIASGTKPKTLAIPIPYSAKAHIFYEISAMNRMRSKRIVIIGSGDAAFDYAINLAKKNKVCILMRGENANCLHLLYERATSNSMISIVKKTTINSIKLYKNKLLLKCSNGETIGADFLLVAIGREPQLDFITRKLANNISGLVKAKKLYIIGDVRNKKCRQAAIAVGDGIRAGMEIFFEIDKMRKENT